MFAATPEQARLRSSFAFARCRVNATQSPRPAPSLPPWLGARQGMGLETLGIGERLRRRPSLTAPARGGHESAGRDERMGSRAEQKDGKERKKERKEERCRC